MEFTENDIIGNINIVVYEDKDGYNIFKISADGEEVLPILRIIEDALADC